jgi:CheY-like chemotaxis protein
VTLSPIGSGLGTHPSFDASHAAERADSGPTPPVPTVLIVEDHVDTAELLRQWLGKRNIGAAITPDAPSAMAWLSRHSPRCLVLDEGIPGTSGLELLRQLKSHARLQAIPVIFYSASYDDGLARDAVALGAEAWFVKGVSRPEDLVSRVQAFCGTIGAPPERSPSREA